MQFDFYCFVLHSICAHLPPPLSLWPSCFIDFKQKTFLADSPGASVIRETQIIKSTSPWSPNGIATPRPEATDEMKMDFLPLWHFCSSTQVRFLPLCPTLEEESQVKHKLSPLLHLLRPHLQGMHLMVGYGQRNTCVIVNVLMCHQSCLCCLQKWTPFGYMPGSELKSSFCHLSCCPDHVL